MMNLQVLSVVFLVAMTAAARASIVTRDQLALLNREEGAAGRRRIIDISHKFVPRMPVFMGDPGGLPSFFVPHASIKHGDMANTLNFTLNDHCGTHLDAPGYYNQTLLEQGYDVDSLDLNTLIGSCLVVDTPRDKNITAEVMAALGIPRGVERVLFKTLNTDKELMNQSRFDPSYTAFTPDGADYLVSHTDIKLVGIDYLSVGVGVGEDHKAVYRTLLNTKRIIPVAGLKLDEAKPGVYEVACLPLRIPTVDASPGRCFLFTSSAPSLSSPGRTLSAAAAFLASFILLCVFYSFT